MHYLRERHVAAGTMVEIAIISVLREIILRGPLEAPWPQLLVATALLAVLGMLCASRDCTVAPAATCGTPRA